MAYQSKHRCFTPSESDPFTIKTDNPDEAREVNVVKYWLNAEEILAPWAV